MAWSTPATFVAGQVVTAANMNAITGNFAILKGSSGTVAIDAGITASGVVRATRGFNTPNKISGLALNIASVITAAGFETVGIISGDTAQIAGVAQVAGIVTSAPISGAGNLTVSGIVTAKGGIRVRRISGASSVTVSGFIRANSGVVNPTHISCGGRIKMQSDKTVDGYDVSVHNAWQSGMHGLLCSGNAHMARVDCGTYTGTGSGYQTISHGVGWNPHIVRIQSKGSGYHTGVYTYAGLWVQCAGEFMVAPSSSKGPNTFGVGVDNGAYTAADMLNASGVTYYWMVCG